MSKYIYMVMEQHYGEPQGVVFSSTSLKEAMKSADSSNQQAWVGYYYSVYVEYFKDNYKLYGAEFLEYRKLKSENRSLSDQIKNIQTKLTVLFGVLQNLDGNFSYSPTDHFTSMWYQVYSKYGVVAIAEAHADLIHDRLRLQTMQYANGQKMMKLRNNTWSF